MNYFEYSVILFLLTYVVLRYGMMATDILKYVKLSNRSMPMYIIGIVVFTPLLVFRYVAHQERLPNG